MELKGMHHFALNVRDMDRAELFYTQVLGFKVVERYNESLKHIELDTGNVFLALFEVPNLDIQPGVDCLSEQGYMHFAFQTTRQEFPEIIDELKQNKVIMDGGPIVLGHGESVYFRDPDGNHLEIRCPVE